jgi:hypothetical protein
MAYMNQERKATIAKAVNPILAKYGMKGSLSVRNHSTIVLTLASGSIDFIGDLNDERFLLQRTSEEIDELRKDYNLNVNPYWYQEHYTGTALSFLSEVIPALKSAAWYDRSDAMTDYFDTAYYFDIHVGKWDKPYTLTS